MDRMSDFIDFDLFCKIVDQLDHAPDTILTLHRRGESLLHPRFIECLSYIEGKFKTVQLATNGTLMNDEKAKAIIDCLSFISFSIDTPERFDLTRRPATYKSVEDKILRFLNLNNGKVETQVSMVQTDEVTDKEAENFIQIWEHRVDKVRIYAEHSKDGKFGSLAESRSNRVPCTMPFYEILVFTDGKVGRCNHDWNGAPLGDLNISSIKDVWKSELYQELRDQHLNLKIIDQVCRNCDSWYPLEGEQQTGELHSKK